MPIRFEYLYRCAGNYKRWGEVFLSNPQHRSLEELEAEIRSNLIDGEFFIAEQIGVPTLYFEETAPELDHGWHEFFGLALIERGPSDGDSESIEAMLEKLAAMEEC